MSNRCIGCDYSSHSNCEHIKKLKAETFEKCIEIVKQTKMRAYLHLANGCNEKRDFAYENVADYLDEIVVELRSKKNDK